jgi:hypothetical protein
MPVVARRAQTSIDILHERDRLRARVTALEEALAAVEREAAGCAPGHAGAALALALVRVAHLARQARSADEEEPCSGESERRARSG